MSRGLDGFDIDDFRDPSGNPNATALAGNQAREEAAVHSLEARSDPNGKTYFSGWTLTLKFTFSVFRCSVYVEGVFPLFLFPPGGNILREYPPVIAASRGTTRRRRT